MRPNPSHLHYISQPIQSLLRGLQHPHSQHESAIDADSPAEAAPEPSRPSPEGKIIKWRVLDLVHGLEVVKATSKAMCALEKEHAWIQALVEQDQRTFLPLFNNAHTHCIH